MPDHIGTGIQARMERRKAMLSLEQMAKQFGKTRSWLSMLEKGQLKWSQKRVDEFNAAVTTLKGQPKTP